MKLIIGLGNPGTKYEKTRHNVGFIVAESLLKDFTKLKNTVWEADKRAKAETHELLIEEEKVLLVKPQTFMNNSGQAVAYLSSYYKIDSKDIILIYDDLDLPLGKIRIRFGGAAGGHKGAESVINALNTDKFLRIRLGIGHPHRREGNIKEGKSYLAVEDYVLQPFASDENNKVRHMTKEAIKSLKLLLKHGIEKYMSKYNGGDVSSSE